MEALKAVALYCCAEIHCHLIFHFVPALTVADGFISYSAFMPFLQSAVRKEIFFLLFFLATADCSRALQITLVGV